MSWGSVISFLNNNWISGIVTGLIGTGIIGVINKFRENKEYKKRIELATNELANTIEAFIPEDQMPKGIIIHSLYNSIARKHLVKTKDMPSFSSTMDYLIHQVMTSNYLAYDIKKNKCEQLLNLKHDIRVVETEVQDVGQLDNEIEQIRERAKNFSGFFFSLFTSFTLTMVISIFSLFNVADDKSKAVFEFARKLSKESLLSNIFSMFSVMALSLGIFHLFRHLRYRENIKRAEKDMNQLKQKS
ncbi:hypothetical protein ACFVSS_16765 [Peribacillus butanolivorans]|uniref:hypothetical protein n=1 Tax=Peribacillus butanolivorans TaxID=421767 RepID=UPI0036DF47FE